MPSREGRAARHRAQNEALRLERKQIRQHHELKIYHELPE